LLLPLAGSAQQINYEVQNIPLYSDSIPNTTGFEFVEIADGPANDPNTYQRTSRPAISIYLPDKERRSRAAVIIFPGGAYTFLAFREEGSNIARNFASHGITAFVVKYRLPDEMIMKDKSIGPLQDAQQAIKIVRMHAADWGIDAGKVGVMGFSAGGHLASTAATHFNFAYIPNRENTNLRPDFQILVYPVISMTEKLTHAGSKDRLLGRFPSPERVKLLSSELQVTDNTPPTWLTHAEDDRLVSVDNCTQFFEALKRHNIPTEMHIYAKGDHGFVLRQPADLWMGPIYKWMTEMGCGPGK